jgi:uncharacterized protein DUF2169
MSDPLQPPVGQPAVSAVRVAGDAVGKGWIVGVVGRRTWSIVNGRCVLAPEQNVLVDEPIYDEERAVLVRDADVILNRTRTDVVVDGHVYPPNGRTPFDFGLQVGSFMRLARAFGPRRVTRGAGGRLRFSPPDAVEKISLGWESAYGGVDLATRAEIGDPMEAELAEAGCPADPRFGLFAYPRNPAGRGYVIEGSAAALDACQLPLIEDARSVLTPDTLIREDFVRWPTGPIVAGFGWLCHAYFPRSATLGAAPLVYDGGHIKPTDFYEVQTDELPEACVLPQKPLKDRLSVSAAQCAAIGMRVGGVRPGDRVDLRGLHPRQPTWAFHIPEETPRMAIRYEGERAIELPRPKIRTVHIEPDADRLTLVWVSELPVAARPGPKRLAGLQHVVIWKG